MKILKYSKSSALIFFFITSVKEAFQERLLQNVYISKKGKVGLNKQLRTENKPKQIIFRIMHILHRW